MKALLTILLLASLAANVALLAGCKTKTKTVYALRLHSPSELLEENFVKSFDGQLGDTPDQQRIFQSERSFLESHQGKIVIFLDDTEDIRTAKAIIVRFKDID